MQMMTLNRLSRVTVTGCLVLAACAQNTDPAMTPPVAGPVAAVAGPNVMADLARDVADVEKKMVDLAKAMPEGTMTWRPMPGVRSAREVFLHIAGENYLIPSFMGTAIPAATGIVGTDFKTVDAFEKRDLKKDQTVADLEASFANLKKTMAADSASTMGKEVDFFGTKMSRQAAWIGTVTHLHEHLGQAIAYARSNKVVPPWSK